MVISLILLILVNAAVMASLYLIFYLLQFHFGVDIVGNYPGDYRYMFIYAMAIGFLGSFVSLLLSKTIAKRSVGAVRIDPAKPRNDFELWLVKTVQRHAEAAGIKMPEVYWYDGPANAFATGWRKNGAMVAVSTGLAQTLGPEEISGVLAHEIGHIKNGDMVRMALLQGVLNTFVIFFSFLIASALTGGRKNDRAERELQWLISLVAQIVLTFFATLILMWYSRRREFRADARAVELDGAEGIYNALAALGSLPGKKALPGGLKAFGIVGFFGLLSSHPPIEKRLRHIEKVAERLSRKKR